MKTKKKIMLGIGRSRGVTYLLRDDFTTTRAAGAINGTLSEPSGHLRTIDDANGVVTIDGGYIKLGAGGVNNNDRVYYPAIARAMGLMVRSQIYGPSTHSVYIGMDTNTTGTPNESLLLNSTAFSVATGGGSVALATIASGGAVYHLCYIAKGGDGSGAYMFIKGAAFTNWELVWSNTASAAGANIPTISRSSGAVETRAKIRVLNPGWLPTPIAYDTFDRANGSAGSTLSTGPEGQSIAPLEWSGGSIAGNVLVVKPSYGSDLITNGGFASDTAWTKGTGWTIGAGVASKAAGTQSDITQPVGTVNKFFEITWDVPTITVAGSFSPIFGNGGWIGRQVNTAPVTGAVSSRWQLSSATIGLLGSSTITGTIDNVVVREIDPTSIFNVLHTSTADVFAEVSVTSVNGTSAGLVLNLDDENAPQNYVIAWHDGVNIHLDKCVGGVLTSLINATQTYAGGGRMKVSKSGTKYRLWYTNTLIGTEQTITDAGIISNTRHGVFSTNVANVFYNFALYARGTNAEYAALDAF